MLRFSLLLIPLMIPMVTGSLSAASVSGASALEFTKRAVDFGPRPAGSEANRALQNYILAQLKTRGCQITEDAFTATTLNGPVAMKNIIAKFPGKGRPGAPAQAIAVTGHFDTKFFPGRKFVGASDGGSSTGLLLEFARALAGEPRIDDVYLVFFDGEEAFGEWTETDSVYGSRHLADRWRRDGTLGRLKALINVDMIGDKNLDIRQEMNSTPSLRKLVWTTAAELGYQAYFLNEGISTDDDHMPFLKLGAPAIDIIDFDYPPWHTDADTMDKVSAKSLEIVGTVVLEAVHRLERE
ncbi:MAG TPA: M28 family peptidase [Bryobacteraceae bacterium]|nr:M28 family peptidase [Bryobacteraceae bacterium]